MARGKFSDILNQSSSLSDMLEKNKQGANETNSNEKQEASETKKVEKKKDKEEAQLKSKKLAEEKEKQEANEINSNEKQEASEIQNTFNVRNDKKYTEQSNTNEFNLVEKKQEASEIEYATELNKSFLDFLENNLTQDRDTDKVYLFKNNKNELQKICNLFNVNQVDLINNIYEDWRDRNKKEIRKAIKNKLKELGDL